MTTHYVTAGGALIGLLAVAARLVPWYRKHGRKKGGEKGGRSYAPLGPFLWTMILGILAALATGGAMGKSAHGIAISSNGIGGALLSSLAGADSPGVTRDGIRMLTPGGADLLIVLLLACLIWFWMHSLGIKLQMLCGLIAGITLGPTAGLAGIVGVIVAPLFNLGGNWIVGVHG